MSTGLQLRFDEMPVPAGVASSVYQDVCAHEDTLGECVSDGSCEALLAAVRRLESSSAC
jgi:hypothetical protein